MGNSRDILVVQHINKTIQAMPKRKLAIALQKEDNILNKRTEIISKSRIMTPKTNTKSEKKVCLIVGKNGNTDVCPEAPFSKDAHRVETSTLTCLMSQWASLYMLRLLMLECIFEWTVRPWFKEAARCHF